jgi:hypothetical protein
MVKQVHSQEHPGFALAAVSVQHADPGDARPTSLQLFFSWHHACAHDLCYSVGLPLTV